MPITSDFWQHLGANSEIFYWKRSRLVRTACYANLALGYILMFNLYCYFLAPTLMALLPQAEVKWREKMEMGFWTVCVYLLERNQWDIEIIGDQLEHDDNALIMSNHCGIVDYLIMGYLVQCSKYPAKTNRVKTKSLTGMFVPHLSFFTWFTIWSVPTVEYIKNIFQTDENWELDGETLTGVFNTFFNKGGVQWLVIFPEVNIFTEKVSKLQKIMGEKYFLPMMKNVLYPRFGGVINAVGGLYETKFTRLYDITLVYYKIGDDGQYKFECPNLMDALGALAGIGNNYKLIVHVKGKFLCRVPLKRNKLEKWVENRWLKKDKLVEKIQHGILKNKWGIKSE